MQEESKQVVKCSETDGQIVGLGEICHVAKDATCHHACPNETALDRGHKKAESAIGR